MPNELFDVELSCDATKVHGLHWYEVFTDSADVELEFEQ
jgi:hypothetical protein